MAVELRRASAGGRVRWGAKHGQTSSAETGEAEAGAQEPEKRIKPGGSKGQVGCERGRRGHSLLDAACSGRRRRELVGAEVG